jgi:CheY-like chemotaxis protein
MSQRKRILVVDDNQNFTALLSCALEDDFDVDTAQDGQEGLDKAFNAPPDLIITDVMMPNVSGVEMLRRLVSEETTRSIPVIVATGSHFNTSMESLFRQESNVRGFIAKTTPIDSIIGLVRKTLGVQ